MNIEDADATFESIGKTWQFVRFAKAKDLEIFEYYLYNGTIYQRRDHELKLHASIVTVIAQCAWRAAAGETYWRISVDDDGRLEALSSIETNCDTDTIRWTSGNYFRSREECINAIYRVIGEEREKFGQDPYDVTILKLPIDPEMDEVVDKVINEAISKEKKKPLTRKI